MPHDASPNPARPANRALVLALWANAALLAVIALVLLTNRDGRSIELTPSAFAQMPAQLAGGAGIFLMPAQFNRDTFGCYLMDVDAQTLTAYQWEPVEKKLRLVAARSFRYDRRLTEYNTESPTPLEVKDLVERAAAGIRGAPQQQQQEPPAPTTQK